jgi:hypothetical protein
MADPTNDDKLFIEKDFADKNAKNTKREIIAKLYLDGECDLEDIDRVSGFLTPHHNDVFVFDGRTGKSVRKGKTLYATVGSSRFEIAFARRGRETGCLLGLLYKHFPELKGVTFKQLAFVHSALDRIIKLNKACHGESWSLETAGGVN